MPLYLSNTNRNESLQGDVVRGVPSIPIPGIISASYTTNSSSLFVITNDAVTKLSTTSSAITNFTASVSSIVSASVEGGTISSLNSVTLFISASDGSLLFNSSTTGSPLMTNFVVGDNVKYTISSSVIFGTGSIVPTGIGLGRQAYIGFYDPLTNPNWPDLATPTGSTIANSGSLVPVLSTGSINTQWLGYFKASTTETYTFNLSSDDSSILWIGNAATASILTTGSALVRGLTGPTEKSGSIALTSGSYYPMRVQYADGLGTQYFTSSFSTTTIAKTTDYTGYTFYNTASFGF
jgi:hypothetical protein